MTGSSSRRIAVTLNAMRKQRTSLSGQVVFITGAARGIGSELARRAVERGAKVALVGLEPDRLQALADELGQAAACFECNVTDSGSLERAARGTVERFGGIDVVVANAGIGGYATVALTQADALAKVVEVNLVGTMRTVSATLEHVIARRGHVLLVSSAAAFSALPGMASYCASKAGVEQFGNVLRQEVVHKGVTVGVAHPCWIDTDMVRDQRAQTPTFDEIHAKLPGPLGSYTSVEECAAAFADGIERRKRRVYVPKSLVGAQALRTLVLSPLGDGPIHRQAKRYLPRLEREMAAKRPDNEIKPAARTS